MRIEQYKSFVVKEQNVNVINSDVKGILLLTKVRTGRKKGKDSSNIFKKIHLALGFLKNVSR